MVFRNLIFNAKVVEQRLRTSMLSHHNPQASVNGDQEEHRQNACSDRRCCQHFSSHSRRLFQQPPLFSTVIGKTLVFDRAFVVGRGAVTWSASSKTSERAVCRR